MFSLTNVEEISQLLKNLRLRKMAEMHFGCIK